MEGEIYQYVDGTREPLTLGIRYTYQVLAVTQRGISGDPASAPVDVHHHLPRPGRSRPSRVRGRG